MHHMTVTLVFDLQHARVHLSIKGSPNPLCSALVRTGYYHKPPPVKEIHRAMWFDLYILVTCLETTLSIKSPRI